MPEPEPCRLRKRAGSGGASRGADKKTRGEIEQATAAATEPIKAFLDQAKRGFGDRFGASFAQEGLTDEQDLYFLESPDFKDILESLLERLEAAGAKPMELNWMKVKLRSRASDEARGQSAGGGTGTVAVGTDDVAARAAAAKDEAAADVNDKAAAAADAAPTALNAHGSGGGEDVPGR